MVIKDNLLPGGRKYFKASILWQLIQLRTIKTRCIFLTVRERGFEEPVQAGQ